MKTNNYETPVMELTMLVSADFMTSSFGEKPKVDIPVTDEGDF